MSYQPGIVCIQSPTAPPNVKLGDEWYNTLTDRTYKWIFVNGAAQWIELLTSITFVLPNWTTTTRPNNPTVGQIGFNTTRNEVETYTSVWI